jgi:hypothetical protein
VDVTRLPSRNMGWIVVLGGGLFLMLITGLLLYLCFSGESTAPEPGPITELPEPEFKPPPPLPLIMLTKEEEERVGELVSRGVAYLKKTQDPKTGTWNDRQHADEYAGMAGLTLLECGVDPKDAVVQRAAGFVRQKAKSFTGTYGLSLYILFLDKLNDPTDKPLIRELAMRLAAGQSAAGGWAYKNKVLTAEQTQGSGPQVVCRFHAGAAGACQAIRTAEKRSPRNAAAP